MEHLYQLEEVIVRGNYDIFKDYYTSSPYLSPSHPHHQSDKLLRLVPDDENSSIALITAGSTGNSSIIQPHPPLSSTVFVDNWNVAHLASQQPPCFWPLLNVACCLLILLGHSIQRRVFGNLRASEQESIKDQFWNLVFYKVVFVFGVVHVQDVEDAVGWCIFVSLIGFLQLARQLCQDRHNYLILVNDWSRRGQCRRHRILGLLCFIFVSSIILFFAVIGWYFFSSPTPENNELTGSLDPIKTVYYGQESISTKSSSHHHHHDSPYNFNLNLHSAIFMMCELGLLVIQTSHVLIICIFEQIRNKWYKGRQMNDETYSNISHSINFKFDLISLLFDLIHHLHMLIYCNLFLSMTSLVVSLQMRNRVRKIHRVLKKRQCYLWLTEHIDLYPDAVFEKASSSCTEEENKCAICWDTLSSQKAKSLPCHHIFHTSCLRQWLIVSMNCPSCRHCLMSQKQEQYRPVERTTRRLNAPRPVGLWGFLQTGQALLDLFGGWDPQYDDSYDEADPPSTPVAVPDVSQTQTPQTTTTTTSTTEDESLQNVETAKQ